MDVVWTQNDDSNHWWTSSPQGGTLRVATAYDSKEIVVALRSSNFSVSGLEAFGPNRGLLGTSASDGLSVAACAGPIRFFTNSYAAANERFRINADGSFVASNVVTADLSASLANSQYQFTVYDNAGTAVFKIRYQDASGTVKTGTLALS